MNVNKVIRKASTNVIRKIPKIVPKFYSLYYSFLPVAVTSLNRIGCHCCDSAFWEW